MGTTVVGTESSSAAWADVKPGLYGATVASYESLGMQSYQGGPEKERMVFNFALDGQTDPETGDPIVLKLYMNLVLSRSSSLAKLLADLGLPWQPGQSFDLDNIVGKRCQAVVKIIDTTGGQRPAITDILPATAARPQAATADITKAADANHAAASAADICKVEGCDKTADYYTARGTPLCKNHSPEDL